MSSNNPEDIIIPTTMKRLVVKAPGPDVASCQIEIEEVPVPKPSSGEVLIKVSAAPINPSDYGHWYRSDPSKKYPLPMGKEGCGVVVASGGGAITNFRFPIGSKVGFIVAPPNQQGSYSEYVVMNVTSGVFVMPDDVPIENCASFFVNPMTVIAILDMAKQCGSPSIVHTAAASQLGQMLIKLAPSEDIEIINVVRRKEQATMIREQLGAKHIVVTSSETEEEEKAWKAELQRKVMELDCKIAFDAVSGRSTGDLLEALPPKGTVYVYGGLAGKVENINPMDLIYHQKQIKGFLLTDWMKDGGMIRMIPRLLSATNKVNSGLKDGGWSSTQFVDTTFEKAHQDIIELLGTKATGKKLRIRIN